LESKVDTNNRKPAIIAVPFLLVWSLASFFIGYTKIGECEKAVSNIQIAIEAGINVIILVEGHNKPNMRYISELEV